MDTYIALLLESTTVLRTARSVLTTISFVKLWCQRAQPNRSIKALKARMFFRREKISSTSELFNDQFEIRLYALGPLPNSKAPHIYSHQSLSCSACLSTLLRNKVTASSLLPFCLRTDITR